VNEEIYFPSQSWRKRDFKVSKEIMPAPPPLHSGMERQIKTQMGISNQQDAQGGLAHEKYLQ
jgi:hypothetical protein